jgi:ribosomal protein S18 acetylase RimI-like enzyme
MTSVFEADLGNPVHAAALVELIAQLAQSHDGRRQPMTSEERAALIPGLKRVPSKHLLLADFNEEICGVAVCFIQFSTFSAREMLRIHDLFVAPDHRRRGIGGLLVGAAIQRAREMGCAFVNLEVATQNSAAIRLYRELKFVDWLTPTQFLELRL